jgi:hypothetical protein
MLCCCHRGAPTKTFVIWLEFYTCDISTHGFWTSCSSSRSFMFLFVTAQIRTCCVCLANVVCCDIHLARSCWHDHVHQAKSWLAREKNDPEIREGPIKPQPLSNWQPPSRGLAVCTSGREITKGGVMQWTCRRSPSRYINLPGSLPEYPRPSLAPIPYSQRTVSLGRSTGELNELARAFQKHTNCRSVRGKTRFSPSRGP